MEEGKEMKLLPLCTLGLLTVLMPFTVVQAADDSANSPIYCAIPINYHVMMCG